MSAMRNITVAVPDDVYRAARIRAAQKGTSVSALVTEFLVGLTRDETAFVQLEEQQRRIMGEIQRFRASDRVSREELHDRALR